MREWSESKTCKGGDGRYFTVVLGGGIRRQTDSELGDRRNPAAVSPYHGNVRPSCEALNGAASRRSGDDDCLERHWYA